MSQPVMQDTLLYLEQHHGDGHTFMQLMKESATKRFDTEFWATWTKWIEPTLSNPPVIADFGCGPAVLLQQLRERYPPARLIAIECAPYMLAAFDNSAYETLVYDLHEANLPLANNSVDVITNIHVLHEMQQPLRVLETCFRCLKPGGRGLLMDWVRAPLSSYLATQSHNIFEDNVNNAVLNDIFTHFMEHNRYTRDDIAWLLNRVGFKVLENVPLATGQFGRWIVQK